MSLWENGYKYKYLGTMVNEKRERGLSVAIFGFCQMRFKYLHLFTRTGGPVYLTPLDIMLK